MAHVAPDAQGDEASGDDGRRRGVVVRHVVVALVLLVAWLAVAGVGGPLFGRLSEVQENDNAAFLPSTAESTQVSEIAAGFTDDESLPFFLLVERDGGLTDDDLAAVTAFAEQVPDVEIPESDGAVVGDQLTGDPVVPVPSEDGDAALLVLSVDSGVVDELLPSGESVLFGLAEALRASLADAVGSDGGDAGDAEVTTAVGGPGGVLADLVTAFSGIDGRLLQVTLGVVFVILLLVYRSPVLPFVALLSAGFALAATGAVIYPLVDGGVIGLNGQSQGIVSILVVGATTDYALLLIARYREELQRHRRAWDAMRVAWRAAFEPILASGTTVVLGLLCLLLSDLGSTRGLGPVGAIGIVAAVLVALTLLPVLLLAGRWLFWPRRPRYEGAATGSADDAAHGLWSRLAAFVGRRARPVWVLTTVALLALAAFAPTFAADGTAQTDVFRDDVESVDATRILGEHFPGGSGSPTLVVAPEADLDAALEVASSVEGVEAVVTTSDGPAGPPGAGAAPPVPLVVDGLVQLEVTLTPAADTPAGEAVVERLRTALDEVGTDVLVGGTTASTLDTRLASERDLVVIVPVVLLVVLLVLVVLLRSLLAPLLLVLANLLSFAATIGAASLVFDHVLDLPGSDPSTPLYGFVFLVALGVDYSIFLMTRVREESGRRGTRPGVIVGLAVTGGVITSAGVVLASTFGALATVPLLFLLQIAFIVAVGVLLDTLVVRSLLVPALAHDLGRHVWWPGRLWRHGPDGAASDVATPAHRAD